MYSMPLRDDRGELPLYTDVRMDYDAGVPVWSGGEPVLVSGLEAVKGWGLEGGGYGAVPVQPLLLDLRLRAGGAGGAALHPRTPKLSEAERYVTEALLVSPYIREARVRDKRFEGSTLHMQVALSTVYGKETIYV